MANKCQYSEVVLTREAGANAIGDIFRQGVSSVPIVGGLFAGLVPDTYTANVLRACPGKVTDKRSSYLPELILGGATLFFLSMWAYFKFSRRK